MKASRVLGNLVVILLSATPARAQTSTPTPKTSLPNEMLNIYEAFKGLQPYLNDRRRFSEESERDNLRRLLGELRRSFHRADKVDQRFAKQPGFNATLKSATEILEDADKRLQEGKLPYAFWRLRSLERKCIVCHVTYNAEVSFEDTAAVVRNMSSYDQGEFFLASRQYARAEEAFLSVLRQSDPTRRHIEALRQWLVLQARVVSDPRRSLAVLREVTSGAVLSEEDREEIAQWDRALYNWEIEHESPNTIPQIEQMIQRAVGNTTIERRADAVSLLRATALLHQMLERVDLEGRERSRALYLLGYSYSHLPLYFMEDLALYYFKQDIEEFPGSDDAKRSFALYKEQVSLSYTGSGGTRMPDDVELEMRQLERKARGIPTFEGRV